MKRTGKALSVLLILGIAVAMAGAATADNGNRYLTVDSKEDFQKYVNESASSNLSYQNGKLILEITNTNGTSYTETYSTEPIRINKIDSKKETLEINFDGSIYVYYQSEPEGSFKRIGDTFISNSQTLDISGLDYGDDRKIVLAFNPYSGDVTIDSFTVPHYNSSETVKPQITNVTVTDYTDGDGVVNSGDKIRFKADVADNVYVERSSVNLTVNTMSELDMRLVNGSYTYTYTVQDASTFGLDSYAVFASDINGNKVKKSLHSHSLAFKAESTDGTDDTTNSTDDNSTSNITALRSAPGTQSFDYLNSWESENIKIENGTVTADGENATYVTEEINSDGFDRVEFNLSNGSATVKVLNASGDAIKSGEYMAGSHTINLSASNATEVRLKFMLENGTELTGLSVYGEMYSGGLFGGGSPITGGFFTSLPVVGGLFEGFATGLANTVNAVLGIPNAIVETVMEAIPFL